MRVRSVSREEVWASAGVQGAWVGGCGAFTCPRGCGVPPARGEYMWRVALREAPHQ